MGRHRAHSRKTAAAQPTYPSAKPLAAIASRLAKAAAHEAHSFVPDDYGLLDATAIAWDQLLGHRQITNSYLLGLAVRHGCRFVSFDARINPDSVPGTQACHWLTL